MISIASGNKPLSHWPGSLSQFGTNLYNENMYRVVWSDTRFHLVGGMWHDYDGAPQNDKELALAGGKDINLLRRVAEYRWVTRYPGVHSWVLEKWVSAYEYAGTPITWEMSMKDKESGLLVCGPYPSRGEYEHCFTFPDHPSISVIERVINWVKAGQNYSAAEHKTANKNALEKEQKDWLSRGMDIWKDSQSPFQGNAMSGSPGRKKKEDINFQYTAQDLKGMKKQDGAFFTK